MTFKKPFACLLLLLCLVPAYANERIKSFHSDIEVKSSGDILVTETITVEVAHNNIKRGIFRDFPTLYKTALMTKSTVDFEVLQVTRNDEFEPHHTTQLSNGVRLYIGDRNRMVDRGEQTYRINYGTNRQIAFTDSFDRFAWNVTGNDWRFRMDQVTAEVKLPDGISMAMVNSEVWTGFAGESSADYTSEINGNVIKVQSTKPLEPYQGLTFSLQIPKGVIVNDSSWLMLFLSDNLFWVLMVVALLTLLMFYTLAWHRVGRDPEAGVIIPLFYPPKDISPAAMRYILEEDTGHKNFTAALINLAVKGYVKLKKISKGYEVVKVQSPQNLKPMSSGESIIMRRLLKSRNKVVIDKKYDAKIKTAMKQLNNRLKTEYKAKCFKDNRMLGFFGVGLSVMTLLFLMIHLNVLSSEFFGGFAVLFAVGGYAFFTIYKSFSGKFDFGNLAFIGLVAVSLFSDMANELPMEVLFFGVFLLVVNAIFIYLLKSPTPFGREMMDDIEGFKLYLSTAEQHRLDIMHPPEMTPELFEKYLPYAIALGVENRWSQRFANHLRSAGLDPSHGDYSPHWYSGSHFNLSSSSGGFSDISKGMASTISAAATPPSSSGGGGGGFSGGGGGGGGGGGW